MYFLTITIICGKRIIYLWEDYGMNTELKRKIALNEARQKELSNRVFNAIENHQPFRIIALDIDNTLINDKPLREIMMREILGEEYEVTMQRADEMFRTGNPDDIALSSALIGNMLDRVLEEAEARFVGRMRYNEIYRIENFFPRTIEFVRSLLASRGENDFVILLSHHNVDREAHAKIDLMYDVFPGLNGIYLPKYHNEPFGVLGRKVVSKVGYLGDKINQDFQIPIIKNIQINLTSNVFMVDDSSTVLLDSLSRGSNIVPFLPSAIPVIVENQFDDFLRRASLYCDMSRVYCDINALDNLSRNKELIK